MAKRSRFIFVIAGLLVLGFSAMAHAEGEDLQKQIDAVKAAIPKFAVPMREVGDRFRDMYYAAKGGNWGLAAYMSKYMNAAMNPAKLTKPNEYTDWVSFYSKAFDPVNKAIMAQNFTTFDKEYKAVIKECNACHEGMGYGFIKIVPLKVPADPGVDYKLKSKATDVPK